MDQCVPSLRGCRFVFQPSMPRKEQILPMANTKEINVKPHANYIGIDTSTNMTLTSVYA